jgi:hypothetical protein
MYGLTPIFRKPPVRIKSVGSFIKNAPNHTYDHSILGVYEVVISIPNDLKSRRHYIFKKMYDAKYRLAHALADKDPVRVREAKIALIRYLLELHESPELGPKREFKLGYRLELLIGLDADPSISLAEVNCARKDWYALAKLLERSIGLRDYDYYPSEVS